MEASLALVPPQLETKALTLVEQAKAMTVTDQATHDEAAERCLGLRAIEKEFDAIHDPAIKAAHDSHKAAIAAKAKIVGPLQEAYKILKPKVTSWEQEQARIQAELQRKAEEAARKAEEEARLALAVQAEQAGAHEETVQEIIATPIPMLAPVVAPTYQKTKGLTSRESWSARVTDIRKLCAEIAAGRQPTNLVEGNMPALNGLARSLKSQMKIPGVEAVKQIV